MKSAVDSTHGLHYYDLCSEIPSREGDEMSSTKPGEYEVEARRSDRGARWWAALTTLCVVASIASLWGAATTADPGLFASAFINAVLAGFSAHTTMGWRETARMWRDMGGRR